MPTSSSGNGIGPDFYDEAYFETGSMVGKSCYTYYHWMPEPTFRMAMAIIEHTRLQRGEAVLDFGCAKGYLVKALRYLFRDAYGCDWSQYAIDKADPDVKDFLRVCTATDPVPFEQDFQLCIAKDVFEHIPHKDLPKTLAHVREKCRNLFLVVPLGDGKKFLIDAYEGDKSHHIREGIDWWLDQLERSGFKLVSKDHFIPGIKENWYKINPLGNACILCE